jgi:anti-sigma-K factor RskA
MSNKLHVTDLLPAYALGSLDDEESTLVAQHLLGCSACRLELAKYETVVGKMALAVPDAAPPTQLKRRVMEQIQRPAREPATAPRRVWWRSALRFPLTSPAWAVASLVLVALLIASNLWWWQATDRDRSLTTSGGMRVIAMVGTEAAPASTGILVIDTDGEYGTLVVEGLPVLDQDHQYQLWLIRDGQRASGGVFSVNPEGYGALIVSSPEPLSSYPAFGITIEPEGGSPGPTGDKVLGSPP